MTPLLPREMLWADLQTMDQFFELDPVNKDFCKVLMTLHEKPFDVKSDEIKVFNEVYYQITRIIYERPAPRDLVNYTEDIRSNMGWNFSVELVMSMLFFITSLIGNRELKLNRFFSLTIYEKFHDSPYWVPFKKCYDSIKWKKSLTYTFPPRPIPPRELARNYVRWRDITKEYDAGAIIEILSLWENEDDKSLLLQMIKSSVKFNSPRLQKIYYNQINSVLRASVFGKEDRAKEDSGLEDRIKELDSRLLIYERENAVFQKLTRGLQSENERLKALLEDKKTDGGARKFTLVEIVNYCKGCVEWNDAKGIVAMLNRLLLLNGCTPEDSKLVISIEDEFKNRKYGNTYIKEQTVIPNVGNYQPQITNQNLELPMPTTGQQEQKLLEDE